MESQCLLWEVSVLDESGPGADVVSRKLDSQLCGPPSIYTTTEQLHFQLAILLLGLARWLSG